MSVRGRLRRLQGVAAGLPCASCGLRPDGPGYILCAERGRPERADEACPSCGRRLYFVVEVGGSEGGTTWEDEGDAEG